MVEAFQNVVMRLAMCGLGVSLAAMALRSRPVRVAFARMLAIWRGLTTFGRFAVCSFLLVGILVGGDKTNSVNNLPPQQMVAPVERQGSDPLEYPQFLTSEMSRMPDFIGRDEFLEVK